MAVVVAAFLPRASGAALESKPAATAYIAVSVGVAVGDYYNRVAYHGWPRETTRGPLETTGDHRVQFPRPDFDPVSRIKSSTNAARTAKATLAWGI